jgi:hypothetical protein
MRPIKATVLSVDKKGGVKLKLESGHITTLPYHTSLFPGQKLLIKYDFTKGKITGVVNPYKEENMPVPAKIEKGGNDNDPEDPELIELSMSVGEETTLN